MDRELSYLNPEGFTIFTSYFHKKRGFCCESLCLHCPYGLTLKKVGLILRKVNLHERGFLESSIKNELEKHDLQGEDKEVYEITLKGYLCGIYLRKGQQTEVILREKFKDQGINEEVIKESLKALNL